MNSKPTIVMLDSATLSVETPFESFSDIAEYKSYEHTTTDQLAARISEATVIITNKVRIDRVALQAAPNLRLIQVIATGVNNIDVQAAEEMGIRVANVVGYSTVSTAQQALALLLGLVNGIVRWSGRAGDWSESKVFWEKSFVPTELAGKRCGIIGLGAIGTRFAELVTALGMEVVGLHRKGASDSVWPRIALDELLATSDVVSLHCPLTAATRNLLGKQEIRQMKPGAILLNVARGGLVDEHALIESLEEGHLGAAGFDVSECEPPTKESPLLSCNKPNLIVTPHIAWAAREAQQRLVAVAHRQIAEFLQGH